jgi:hypothetical protein
MRPVIITRIVSPEFEVYLEESVSQGIKYGFFDSFKSYAKIYVRKEGDSYYFQVLTNALKHGVGSGSVAKINLHKSANNIKMIVEVKYLPPFIISAAVVPFLITIIVAASENLVFIHLLLFLLLCLVSKFFVSSDRKVFLRHLHEFYFNYRVDN